MSESAKERIAILGGGVGAMTAASELTDPSLNGKYDVTVYQMGWRLGGKGASGRNMDPEFACRIEEHGVHVWSGLYDNAFRIMRKVYGELGRPPDAPLAGWQDAFKPKNFLVVAEEYKDEWYDWIFEPPVNDELPGEPDAHMFLPFWSYIGEGFEFVFERYMAAHHQRAGARQSALGSLAGSFFKAASTIGLFLFKLVAGLLRTIFRIGRWFNRVLGGLPHKIATPFFKVGLKIVVAIFLALLGRFVRSHWKKVQPHLDDLGPRRTWIFLNFAYGNLRGMLADDIVSKGFGVIDDQDYVQWLSQYIVDDQVDGRSLTLTSPLARFYYDAVFSYVDGDQSRPNVSAAVNLYVLTRMALTWKGAIIWEMQAGMGDTVFGPIYEVLKRRGVKFRFFHQVTNLRLDESGARVDAIEMIRQAKVRGDEYEPLVDVNGLPCWPSAPLFDQLEDGERLNSCGVDYEAYFVDPEVEQCLGGDIPGREELTIRLGEDFDKVVLGISLGGIPYVCGDLIEASEAWQDMVRNVRTVRTQAMQLWLEPTAYELGWTPMGRPLASTFDVMLLDTWADMTHLVGREGWPSVGARYPNSIAYFCGAMAEDGPVEFGSRGLIQTPEELSQRAGDRQAKENGRTLLTQYIGHFWKNAVGPDGKGFKFDMLVDNRAGAPKGEARFDSQFFRGNVQPTERYVLSLSGTARYRLHPAGSGFENLFLAGDWTQNTFDTGCVEAATISGLLAANAISGFPARDTIVGLTFGHPEME